MQRGKRYRNVVDRVNTILIKLNKITNKQLLFELNTRFIELNYQIQLTGLIVEWLQINFVENKNSRDSTNGLKKYFTSVRCDSLEPWVFRGGLYAELRVILE